MEKVAAPGVFSISLTGRFSGLWGRVVELLETIQTI